MQHYKNKWSLICLHVEMSWGDVREKGSFIYTVDNIDTNFIPLGLRTIFCLLHHWTKNAFVWVPCAFFCPVRAARIFSLALKYNLSKEEIQRSEV